MMFKRVNTEMLKADNYHETLAYVATRMMKYKTPEAQENEAYRIDEMLWDILNTEKAQKIENASDNLLRVSTAINMIVDACYREAWN